MSIGDSIKKRRFELRMSQQELADAMGYKTRSTIAKIESGENDVSHKKLQKFAQALDTTPEALVGGYAIRPREGAAGAVRDEGRCVAIILAGGKSGRNRQNIPTQFININGKPILVYSMDAYQDHPAVDDIYVVCLKGWESIVRAYAGQYGITKLRGIVAGGSSGMASLKNALDHVAPLYNDDDLVIIQEASRPMVSVEMLSTLLRTCRDKPSATICHRMNDYVQFRVGGGRAEYVDRDEIVALQSPEAHRLKRMKEVFGKAQALHHPLTESCCTMLLYNLGYDINFIESNVNNIKITREEDIAAFSALIRG